MLVTRGYKFALQVNNKERSLLRQCAGTSRFAWNWGLAQRLEKYKHNTGKARFTNAMKQHKELNQLKKTNFIWMYNYSKCVPQEALRDLDQAFKNFLMGRKQGRKVGFPKFKKKNRTKASFRLTGVIRIFPDLRLIQLPRLGKLRLKESPKLSKSSHILSVTVSCSLNTWYVSLTVEEVHPDPSPMTGEILGLDVGLRRFAVLSNGLIVPPPRFLLQKLKKLQRLSRHHSRKKKGSHNRRKSATQLAHFYQRVTNSRQDFLHKLSTMLAKNHSVLVVENLHIKGLMMNKKQAKSWHDLAHGEFHRMLTYKTTWYGSILLRAPRFFPSSKLCSNCLWYNKDFVLKDRTFVCQLCGVEFDRDLNAAHNLENYYYCYAPVIRDKAVSSHLTVAASSPETLNACGELVRPRTTGLDSLKQE